MCSGLIVSSAAKAGPGRWTDGVFAPPPAPPSAQPSRLRQTIRNAETLARTILAVPCAVPCIDRHLPVTRRRHTRRSLFLKFCKNRNGLGAANGREIRPSRCTRVQPPPEPGFQQALYYCTVRGGVGAFLFL